jgi:hypothetical protein
MHNEDNIMLRKIPLDKLISVLVEMYNHGVDYVDIGGVPGEEQDKVAISFTKDYMSEEGKEHIDNAIDDLEIDEEFFKTKLTDEDLDELI